MLGSKRGRGIVGDEPEPRIIVVDGITVSDVRPRTMAPAPVDRGDADDPRPMRTRRQLTLDVAPPPLAQEPDVTLVVPDEYFVA